MKTNDFINIIKSLGYEAVEDGSRIAITNVITLKTLLTVSKDILLSIDNDYPGFENLGNSQKVALMSFVYQYALTLIEERQDDKKYRLKMSTIEHDDSYLNLNSSNGKYFVSDQTNFDNYQTVFTEQEVEDLFEENPAFETIFDKVEV